MTHPAPSEGAKKLAMAIWRTWIPPYTYGLPSTDEQQAAILIDCHVRDRVAEITTGMVLSILKSYRCQHSRYADDGGMQLVDLFTSGRSDISIGNEELELLADHIASELADALASAAGGTNED